MDKRLKLLFTAIAMSLLIALVSTSYAFFSIANNKGNMTTINTGTMSIEYNDGDLINVTDIIPGDHVDKIFTIRNTGTLPVKYDIYLDEVTNAFVDQSDLVYELISNDGGYNTSNQVQVPNATAKIVDDQTLAISGLHTYTLRITFLNKNENQDDNQGKRFSAKIRIESTQDSMSNNDIPLISTCPDCKYTFHLATFNNTDASYSNTLFYGSGATTLTNEQLSNLKDNYQDVISESKVPYFLGLKINENTNVIEKAYACGIENGSPVCLEGSFDGSTYLTNKDDILLPNFSSQCSVANIGDPVSVEVDCVGDLTKYANENGGTGIYDPDIGGCFVDNDGKTYCDIWGEIPITCSPGANENYTMVSGSICTPGSEVDLGGEHFFVVGLEDSTHVRLISKYPLNVGDCPFTASISGIQESQILSDPSVYDSSTDSYCYRGVVPFASSSYWIEENSNSIKSDYVSKSYYRHVNGSSDSVTEERITQVYDENSNLYNYINNYVNYLNNKGYDVTGRVPYSTDFYEEHQENGVWVNNCVPGNSLGCYLPYFSEGVFEYVGFWLGDLMTDGKGGQGYDKDYLNGYSTGTLDENDYEPDEMSTALRVHPLIILDID